jgi:hypothetical protein
MPAWTKEIAMKRVGLGVLVAFLVAVYAHAACGPLRLTAVGAGDGPGYLGMASWIIDGLPSDMHEMRPDSRQFPLGYPLLIAFLSRCGLGARTLMALNFACLGLGLCASWAILRNALGLGQFAAISVLILSASSIVMSGLTVAVASELPFFAVALVSVLLLERRQLVLATAFIAVAISLRAAGVSLIPALVWVILSDGRIRKIINRRAIAVATLPALGAVSAISVWLSRTDYVRRQMHERLFGGHYQTTWQAIWVPVVAKLTGVGEIFTNMAASDFPRIYRDEFAVLGAILLGLVFVGIWPRVRDAASVYLASYLVLIAAYPFFSAESHRRFLLPILPLLFGFACLGVTRLLKEMPHASTTAKRIGIAYLMAFAVLGCVLSFQSARVGRCTDDRAASAIAAIRPTR